MNDNVLNILKPFLSRTEGCRYVAYRDTGGVLTIGIGSTSNVTEGMTIDDAGVLERLKNDLHNADLKVISDVTVLLNDNQYACVLDCAYNLTTKSFIHLATLLNQSTNSFELDLIQHCRDMQGNYLKGLVKRRIADRLLFNNMDWLNFVNWAEQPMIVVSDMINRYNQIFPGS